MHLKDSQRLCYLGTHDLFAAEEVQSKPLSAQQLRSHTIWDARWWLPEQQVRTDACPILSQCGYVWRTNLPRLLQGGAGCPWLLVWRTGQLT